MKIKSQIQKAKTISEVCGQREDAFQLFLAAKNTALDCLNKRVEKRIRESLARQMAWAA